MFILQFLTFFFFFNLSSINFIKKFQLLIFFFSLNINSMNFIKNFFNNNNNNNNNPQKLQQQQQQLEQGQKDLQVTIFNFFVKIKNSMKIKINQNNSDETIMQLLLLKNENKKDFYIARSSFYKKYPEIEAEFETFLDQYEKNNEKKIELFKKQNQNKPEKLIDPIDKQDLLEIKKKYVEEIKIQLKKFKTIKNYDLLYELVQYKNIDTNYYNEIILDLNENEKKLLNDQIEEFDSSVKKDKFFIENKEKINYAFDELSKISIYLMNSFRYESSKYTYAKFIFDSIKNIKIADQLKESKPFFNSLEWFTNGKNIDINNLKKFETLDSLYESKEYEDFFNLFFEKKPWILKSKELDPEVIKMLKEAGEFANLNDNYSDKELQIFPPRIMLQDCFPIALLHMKYFYNLINDDNINKKFDLKPFLINFINFPCIKSCIFQKDPIDANFLSLLDIKEKTFDLEKNNIENCKNCISFVELLFYQYKCPFILTLRNKIEENVKIKKEKESLLEKLDNNFGEKKLKEYNSIVEKKELSQDDLSEIEKFEKERRDLLNLISRTDRSSKHISDGHFYVIDKYMNVLGERYSTKYNVEISPINIKDLFLNPNGKIDNCNYFNPGKKNEDFIEYGKLTNTTCLIFYPILSEEMLNIILNAENAQIYN